jgi:hypothetical protein
LGCPALNIDQKFNEKVMLELCGLKGENAGLSPRNVIIRTDILKRKQTFGLPAQAQGSHWQL